MKKLAIFPNQVSTAGRDVYSDFARSTGWQLEENCSDADAALIWSVLWNGRMVKNREVFKHYQYNKIPVIILETGVIKRNVTYKVSVNGTDAYGSYWQEDDDMSDDRFYGMFSHIKPIKGGDTILICGQNPHSYNWQKWHYNLTKITPEDWVRKKVAQYQEVYDGPIEIRPHPRYGLNIPELQHLVVGPKFTVKDDTDLTQAFERARMVVNFNSYPGIQAKMHGLPVDVHHSSLASIDTRPWNADTYEDWIKFIARTEFYHEEIRSGFAWDKIKYAVDLS